MSANDAFTAGVRPGGLTCSTEIRLLLCYLVKNAGPITRQEIENALMEEALVNYFEIGSCLDDITKQALVTLTGDSYTITDKGNAGTGHQRGLHRADLYPDLGCIRKNPRPP